MQRRAAANTLPHDGLANQIITQLDWTRATCLVIDIGTGGVRIMPYDKAGARVLPSPLRYAPLTQPGVSEIQAAQCDSFIASVGPVLDEARQIGIPNRNILIVATEPMRVAPNRVAIKTKLEKTLGVAIEVLTAEDEMIYYGDSVLHRHPNIEAAYVFHCGNGNMGMICVKRGQFSLRNVWATESGGCLERFYEYSDICERTRSICSNGDGTNIFVGTGAAFCSLVDKSLFDPESHFYSMPIEDFWVRLQQLEHPTEAQSYVRQVVTNLLGALPHIEIIIFDKGSLRDEIGRQFNRDPDSVRAKPPSLPYQALFPK